MVTSVAWTTMSTLLQSQSTTPHTRPSFFNDTAAFMTEDISGLELERLLIGG
jgi:hypothetical protein